MRLPIYHETFTPILETLKNGEKVHRKELNILVRDRYYSDLPEELLNQKTTMGGSTLFSRIGWGKSYLKLGKFLHYPARGMVQITQKGKDAIAEGGVVLRDLKNDSDYISHITAREANKELDDNGKDNNPENLSSQSLQDLSPQSDPQDLIDEGFPEIEKQVKLDLLDRLASIDPYSFQRVILTLLEEMGYGIPIETPKSRDGGIDGIIHEDQLGLGKIYIQAKRYDKDRKIREKDIRDFIGAMSSDTNKGVFVTTSEFDASAEKKANGAHHSIILIDGSKLADLMYQYGVGVQVRKTYVVKKVDEDFFEED